MNNDERLLNAAITNFKSSNGIKNDKTAFDYFTISQILKGKGMDTDFEEIENSIVDNGGDGGIDSINVFINDRYYNSVEELKEANDEFDANTSLSIFIIQNKDQNSIKESVFAKLIPTFRDMFNYSLGNVDLERNYNAAIVEKILLVRESIDEVMVKSNNVSLYVNYACKGNTNNISEGVKHKKSILRDIIDEMITIPNVSIEILGANELRTLYANRIEDELILKYDSEISTSSNMGEGYIVTVNLKNYYNFVTKENRVRESLLESNVRHYQGSVTVNRKISSTLNNEEDIEFWWLNNGISILVSELIPLPNKRLKLKDPQVVNGLQTTFSIANYVRENRVEAENRSVLIKIIKTNDKRIIDKVISATNSQTEVRPADLRATDDLQRDIEQYFLSHGYYYDRRKNYYKNQNKDRSKIFNIAKTAQYIETLLYKRPHTARSNPTTLLKGDESYNKIFNRDTNIESYLKSCIIFKIIDSYIKDHEKDNDPLYMKFGASMKHFSFHIMYITISLMVEKVTINADDLARLNTEDISKDLIDESVSLLTVAMDMLNERDAFENAISVAKVKVLTDEIIKGIEGKLAVNQ